MAMSPWEPYDDSMDEATGSLMPLRRAMNRLLEDSFIRAGAMQPFRQVFPLDVRETGNEYVLDVSLPGVKPEDIKITAVDNVLTIRPLVRPRANKRIRSRASMSGGSSMRARSADQSGCPDLSTPTRLLLHTSAEC